MKHRIRVLLLALLMAAGIFCWGGAAARAEEIYSEGPLYYTVGNESVTIVGCFGKHEEIEVPAMIAGYPVNTIASGAFTGNEYLKVLKLPDTISKIEGGAIGPGIYVIYNANTDHPQDTPTDLILGLLDPVPPETPPVTEEPIEEPPEETPEPVTQGSGEGDLDEDKGTTPIIEQDEDLPEDTEETPEATETPAPSETPAPTEAPAPETPAAQTPEKTPEKTAEQTQEAEAESGESPAEAESGAAQPGATALLGGILGGMAVLTGGAWLLSKRKKDKAGAD